MNDRTLGERPARGRCEGLRLRVETDLTPRSPFHIDPGWYDAHWYGAKADARPGRVRLVLRGLSHALVAPAAAALVAGAADLRTRLARRTMEWSGAAK